MTTDGSDDKAQQRAEEQLFAAWSERFGGESKTADDLLPLVQELGLDALLEPTDRYLTSYSPAKRLEYRLIDLFRQERAGKTVLYIGHSYVREPEPRRFRLIDADWEFTPRRVVEFTAGQFRDAEIAWPDVKDWENELRLLGYEEDYTFSLHAAGETFATSYSLEPESPSSAPPFLIKIELGGPHRLVVLRSAADHLHFLTLVSPLITARYLTWISPAGECLQNRLEQIADRLEHLTRLLEDKYDL